MSTELINQAIDKGAKLYASISGGKDGDAMVESLAANKYHIEGLIHADLGRAEWHESLGQCKKCSMQFYIPLHIATRADGRDMVDHWQARLETLKGTDQPFWSSSEARYCTSDMKRDPINKFLRGEAFDFVISCEGIRAEESTERAKKIPLEIRTRITSSYYTIKKQYTKKNKKGKKVKAWRFVRWMTVEEAIAAYKPGKRLALTWFPIFNMTLPEVWATKGQTPETLATARSIYQATATVPAWWPFHPAYVYGNDRVSCVFCVLGSTNDLKVGAKHRPDLLQTLIAMEIEGDATFKNGWSLTNLITDNK